MTDNHRHYPQPNMQDMSDTSDDVGTSLSESMLSHAQKITEQKVYYTNTQSDYTETEGED